MKNNIVFYLSFLLFASLFSSCTTKDKQVPHPVSGTTNTPAVGTGTVVIDGGQATTKSYSLSGKEITFGNSVDSRTIKLTFNTATLADGNYTTKSTVSADTEVKVEIIDGGETYVVEEDAMVMIMTVPSGSGANVTNLVLAGAEALPTVDTQKVPLQVIFQVIIK